MKKGFTLSEVLITLGIVGVVAVLAIPGVMRNYQNRLYTAQLQKTYAQISDAIQSIMNDEQTDDFYETTAGSSTACNAVTGVCIQGVGYFLTKYFKNIKTNCRDAAEPCISKQTGFYRTMAGTNISRPTGEYYVQTVTGATIGGSYNPSNNCTSLLVDVNGLSLPNIAGRDIFAIDIRKNGTLADYASGCNINSAGAAASNCGANKTSAYEAAAGCLNNVIESGWKMEY